ncbi:MAG: sterol desaturase family protein, partial [Nitrospirota bacterium]|nr:sterol desaturase family protein [Nitrospirota bacterium]
MAPEMNVELLIRISAFIGIFAIMAAWERLAPRRQWSAVKATRWVTNLAMAGFNTLLIRVLLASGAFGAAVVAGQGEVGLF